MSFKETLDAVFKDLNLSPEKREINRLRAELAYAQGQARLHAADARGLRELLHLAWRPEDLEFRISAAQVMATGAFVDIMKAKP